MCVNQQEEKSNGRKDILQQFITNVSREIAIGCGNRERNVNGKQKQFPGTSSASPACFLFWRSFESTYVIFDGYISSQGCFVRDHITIHHLVCFSKYRTGTKYIVKTYFFFPSWRGDGAAIDVYLLVDTNGFSVLSKSVLCPATTRVIKSFLLSSTPQ